MSNLEQQIEERLKQIDSMQQPLVIFGRDITKIPCYRQSILNGVMSGVGAGILVFMFTSRPRYAAHSVMATMSGVSIIYYVVCRYQYAKEKRMVATMRGLMQEALTMEGLERDEKFKQAERLLGCEDDK